MEITRVTIGDNLPGTLTPEDGERLGIKEWKISDETVAKIERIEASVYRPYR